MKTEELNGRTLEELHRLAVASCGPQFQKRIHGFMAGHRRFLFALLERSRMEETKRLPAKKTEGGA